MFMWNVFIDMKVCGVKYYLMLVLKLVEWMGLRLGLLLVLLFMVLFVGLE